MKSRSTLLFILSVLCLFSCSSPETPEQVLRRLMETKMKDGKFTEPISGMLTRIPNSEDGVDYSLEGKYRMRNGVLIITILESGAEASQQYATGVFTGSDTGWKSVFETELIPGRLDTLLDLNHDGADEFILDEYQGNSAGFDSYQFLYVKRDKSYEKIDTLSRRMQGSGVYIISTMSFEDRGDQTVLVVGVREANYFGDVPTEKSRTYTYRWQSPDLVKGELINTPEDQMDEAEFPDPLAEDLAGFPTKWFPLTESGGKLKRQQLCGVENFIEIVSGEQHTWHEKGYQDVWEASIDAFRSKGEGSYLVTLKQTDGNKKEINIERNLEVDFVYTIDGKTYTPQPDKFEVSNSTEDCGN